MAERFTSEILEPKQLFLDFLLTNCDFSSASAQDNADLLTVILNYRLRDSTSVIGKIRDRVFSQLDQLSLDTVATLLAKIDQQNVPYGPTAEELLPIAAQIGQISARLASDPSAKEHLKQKQASRSRFQYLSSRIPQSAIPSSVQSSSISSTLSASMLILRSLYNVAELETNFRVTKSQQTTMSDQSTQQLDKNQTESLPESPMPSFGSLLSILTALVNDYIPADHANKCISQLFEILTASRDKLPQMQLLSLVKCILAWESRTGSYVYSHHLSELVNSPKLAVPLTRGLREYIPYAAVLKLTKRDLGHLSKYCPAIAKLGEEESAEAPKPKEEIKEGKTQVNAAEQRVKKILSEVLQVPVSEGRSSPDPLLQALPTDLLVSLPWSHPSSPQKQVIVEVNGEHHYTSHHIHTVHSVSSCPPRMMHISSLSFPPSSPSSPVHPLVTVTHVDIDTQTGRGRGGQEEEGECLDVFRGSECVRMRALTLKGYTLVTVDVVRYPRGELGDHHMREDIKEVFDCIRKGKGR